MWFDVRSRGCDGHSQIGGVSAATLAEDTDLTMRIVLSGGRIRYDITAVDTEMRHNELSTLEAEMVVDLIGRHVGRRSKRSTQAPGQLVLEPGNTLRFEHVFQPRLVAVGAVA